jgi:hypothetical protein
MIKTSQKSLYLLAALAALFYTNAAAKERLTCPSLEKAAELADMEVRHYGDTDWEIESKDEGVFYVSVGYKNCLFRFVANMSQFIPKLSNAGEEWGNANKIGNLIESDGKVFFKHHVLLPFASEQTLSHNIKMFDFLAAKAIDKAIETQSRAEGGGERL